MKFVLTTWALGTQPRIEIDEQRYSLLRDAVKVRGAALEVEEKFDLLLDNYEEFEREVLTIALRYMIRPMLSPSRMSGEWLDLHRRLANLLTTCRLYVDQVQHDLAAPPLSLSGDDTTRPFGAEYDSSLGYRVMEALRNHLQHRSLPITGSYNGSSSAIGGSQVWAFNLTLTPNLDHLRSDKTFKASVLREIEVLPERARDLLLFVRQYIAGLARAHSAVRALIDTQVRAADAAVSAALDEWRAAGNRPELLVAAQFRPDRTGFGEIYLSLPTHERRIELVTVNSSLEGLSRRYVTSVRREEAYVAATSPGTA